MKESWNDEDYLVLFSNDEVPPASERYGISGLLPGYSIVGLRGWDDFIVQDQRGDTFTAPTVPCDHKYLAPFQAPDVQQLRTDERFTGRVKWYAKPIVFGGDPNEPSNMDWVTHSQHAELVRWWNEKYHGAAPSSRTKE